MEETHSKGGPWRDGPKLGQEKTSVTTSVYIYSTLRRLNNQGRKTYQAFDMLDQRRDHSSFSRENAKKMFFEDIIVKINLTKLTIRKKGIQEDPQLLGWTTGQKQCPLQRWIDLQKKMSGVGCAGRSIVLCGQVLSEILPHNSIKWQMDR